VAELRLSLTLWRRLAAAQARSQMQYPASFALLCFVSVLGPLVDLVALLIVFHNTPLLATWTRDQVVLLYGVTGAAFWTGDAVVGNVDRVSEHIRNGTFDAFLLRPVPSLVQVCADSFALRRFAKVLLVFAVLALVVRSGVVAWTPAHVAILLGAVATGFVIFSAIWVATSAVAFWLVDAREFGNAFTYGGGFLANQPLAIYSAWLRQFVTYVLPIAFATYLPVAAVLGKPTGLPSGLVALCPLVALASAVAARATWQSGVRHYRSTGS
jgi:ABC-2 type transport system permease protein